MKLVSFFLFLVLFCFVLSVLSGQYERSEWVFFFFFFFLLFVCFVFSTSKAIFFSFLHKEFSLGVTTEAKGFL